MHEEQKINPKHREIRQVLRIAGPLAAGLGLLLIAIGFGSFFMSFGGGGPPRFFWCAFLGMPILFVGTAMCMFGFMGAVARYQAGEVAPVGKDTFNYLAEGTEDGVQTVAAAVGAGLAQVHPGHWGQDVSEGGDPQDRGAVAVQLRERHPLPAGCQDRSRERSPGKG